MTSNPILVLGGGLAGCEAACQLARRGHCVRILEMRPSLLTPAHRTGMLAELVCTNSLKSERLEAAHGALKAELAIAGSLLLEVAQRTRVPAGQALATLLGARHLCFYDAIAPIVDGDSVDRSLAFWASRYDKGGADYLRSREAG